MKRPSRAQQNLLEFIENFVDTNGYGPSYREIKRAMNYKSVSTVATHINGLIAKNKLKKHKRSARSLEVVKSSNQNSEQKSSSPETWLNQKIDDFVGSENADDETLQKLAESFKMLGLKSAENKVKKHLNQDE